jgi:glycosyltransferase involved in cell wall biosynthesis
VYASSRACSPLIWAFHSLYLELLFGRERFVPDARFRVMVLCSHPVQYMAPVLRRMAQHPQVDLRVVYCSLRGAKAAYDPEFTATVKWDIPVLEGYEWTEIPNQGSGSESFFGLCNFGIWNLIRHGQFDAIICLTGYIRASFWIAFFAARTAGSAFLFGTDANSLAPRDARSWKILAKRFLWPHLYSLADQVVVPSTATYNLLHSLGIPEDRITLTPYSVDNDWWKEQSSRVDRIAVRRSWGIAPGASVILFCAKLQPWKRPFDLLRAFALVTVPNSALVFVGEGPLRSELETAAASLGISERVHFLGFVNQSQLPSIYTASDLMVLPSEYEPFAVVVNEASCCGCPVIASDRVGAAQDLIAPVNPSFIYPCGNIDALAQLLKVVLADPVALTKYGDTARQRMETWSIRENISGSVEAIRRAVARLDRDDSTKKALST